MKRMIGRPDRRPPVDLMKGVNHGRRDVELRIVRRARVQGELKGDEMGAMTLQETQ